MHYISSCTTNELFFTRTAKGKFAYVSCVRPSADLVKAWLERRAKDRRNYF